MNDQGKRSVFSPAPLPGAKHPLCFSKQNCVERKLTRDTFPSLGLADEERSIISIGRWGNRSKALSYIPCQGDEISEDLFFWNCDRRLSTYAKIQIYIYVLMKIWLPLDKSGRDHFSSTHELRQVLKERLGGVGLQQIVFTYIFQLLASPPQKWWFVLTRKNDSIEVGTLQFLKQRIYPIWTVTFKGMGGSLFNPHERNSTKPT